MKKFFALFLSLALCFSLSACGSQKEPADTSLENAGTRYDNYESLKSVLGYDMFQFEDESLTLTGCSIQDENIGVLTYSTDKNHTVTLKMTVDETSNETISILSEETKQQGGVQAPSGDFGPLNVYLDKEANLCFCPFTYTSGGYTCYLYLSETDTSFNTGFSDRLIDFVDLLYQSTDTPSYATYLDNIAKAEAAAEKAREEAAKPKEETTPKQDKTSDEDKDQDKTGDSKSDNTDTQPSEDTTPESEETPVTTEPETPAATGGITLKYYDITLVNIGDAYTFSPSGGASPYTWKSANTNVASVSSGGTVTAVGSGQTTVTCTSSDGLSVEIIVRVK